jgi:hypothetical protein
MATPDIPKLVNELFAVSIEERAAKNEEIQSALSNTKKKEFRKAVKERQLQENDEESEASDVEFTPKSSKKGTKEIAEEKKAKGKGIEITEEEAEKFWAELEALSGDQIIDNQVVLDFQYIGFNPNVILKSIISRGRSARKSNEEIVKDISQMCTIAIIKGSVTDTNLKKMSEAGKRTYTSLETTYGLKRNGSKGLDPQEVTIARVGAAFPGSMMKILMVRPDLSKKFSGPFSSKTLPPYLRHQSAAACIPETLNETAKSFLIGLIVAYTSDQSRVISKSKDKTADVYERQENFITQTHSSSYPAEEVRKKIFKTWTLIADFDKLKQVGDVVAKEITTFTSISKEDLQKAVSGVS